METRILDTDEPCERAQKAENTFNCYEIASVEQGSLLDLQD